MENKLQIFPHNLKMGFKLPRTSLPKRKPLTLREIVHLYPKSGGISSGMSKPQDQPIIIKHPIEMKKKKSKESAKQGNRKLEIARQLGGFSPEPLIAGLKTLGLGQAITYWKKNNFVELLRMVVNLHLRLKWGETVIFP